jgi:hypothetical protein
MPQLTFAGVPSNPMLLRGLLFIAWAVIGTAASYGLPYSLSFYGMLILGTCLFTGLALPRCGGSRMPEILGLLAGPGIFCFVIIAAGYEDALPLAVAGASFIGAALAAYTLAGRARCAPGR